MVKNQAPVLSVVMPVYNASTYLEQTVRSVLAQTFTDFELVAADDKSTDNSLAILRKLANEDSRIIVLEQAENGGAAMATNAAIAKARGRYVALMDADDICHPERFAKQIAYLENHPQTGVVGTQYSRLAPDGTVLRRTRSAHGDATMRFKILFSVPQCNPTTMLRREVLDAMAPNWYNLKLIGAADYDFFTRIPPQWALHVLPDYLFFYRIHPQALGTTKKDQVMTETLELCRQHLAQVLPAVAGDSDVMEFIRLHRDTRGALDGTQLKSFGRGLDKLVAAYNDGKSFGERIQVKAFALELEAKTMLGRYRLYKKPALLLRWLPMFMLRVLKGL